MTRHAPTFAALVWLCACTETKAPAPAKEVEPQREVEPGWDPPRPLYQPREVPELTVRSDAQVDAGPGWITTGYVNRLAFGAAYMFRPDIAGDQRPMVAIMQATLMFEPRIPQSLVKQLRELVKVSSDDRAVFMAEIIVDHAPLVQDICGTPEVFRTVAGLPPEERDQAIGSACQLHRFGLSAKAHGGLLGLVASMLYVSLDQQGGVLDLERAILRDIIDQPPLVHDSYLAQRAWLEGQGFAERRPAPQSRPASDPPPGVEAITYPSDEGELAAWLAIPGNRKGAKLPALVYFHGGFALEPEDFSATKPFREAGYVVMTPAVRGENGNPGHFELLLGEVDDAAAAIRWIARHPRVDPKRVYAFGHSAGGGLAALVTLVEGLPLVHTGSAGGLFMEHDLVGFADIAPFDVMQRVQTAARTVFGHVDEMHYRHYAWFGLDDPMSINGAVAVNVEPGDKLHADLVPGDHHAALGPALEAYLTCIEDPKRCPARIRKEKAKGMDSRQGHKGARP